MPFHSSKKRVDRPAVSLVFSKKSQEVNLNENNTKELVKIAAQAAYDKKGEDIIILNIGKIAPYITDYFLIVTGKTADHLRAIADFIDEKLSEKGVFYDHIEGYEVGRWILMDYVDFVVHIMLEEARAYYGLENLWGDAEEERFDVEVAKE